MKKTSTKLAALLPILIPLLTCSLPPYDEGLSLGLETAKKMTELGVEPVEVGPIREWENNYDYRNREFYFMPIKGTSPAEFKSGFIVSVDEHSFELSFIESDILLEEYNFYRGWGEEITNEDPNSSNFIAETVLKTGPTLTPPPLLNFVRFDAKDYANNDLRVIKWESSYPYISEVDPSAIDTTGNLPNLSDLIYSQWFSTLPQKVPIVIGASISPIDSSNELQVFFCKFEGSGDFTEIFYPTATGAGINVTSGTKHRDDLDFNFPDEVENGFYYHVGYGSLDLSFFSYYSKTQRKYKNYRWGPGTPSAVLTPLYKMERRIDAALSNGDLLSLENNRCYVYNSDGKKQYDFLLGGLHFCYEIYYSGAPHIIFTLPAWLSIHNWEDELRFYVYIFPTERLSELQ
jgi:hypothetical protein